MINLKNNFNKILRSSFGPISGLFSGIIYFISILISVRMMPGIGFNYMVSILGGIFSPGAILFNFGVVFSGILAIPLFYYIYLLLKNDLNALLKKIALITALISCISFCLVGVFPSYVNDSLFELLHGLFFLISMLGAIVYLPLYSLFFLKSNQSLRILSYICYIALAIIIIFLVTWSPLIEWIMTFAIIIWIIFISTYLLVKRF